jgi:hypothetical protein
MKIGIPLSEHENSTFLTEAKRLRAAKDVYFCEKAFSSRVYFGIV